jgi:hypothetical protein
MASVSSDSARAQVRLGLFELFALTTQNVAEKSISGHGPVPSRLCAARNVQLDPKCLELGD